jgi:NitT/TauT family transport system substrate-binding protein
MTRLVVCLIALAFVSGAAQAEPVKIRIQWVDAPGHTTPLVPEAPKEIYRHYGKSYTVETLFLAGSGPALTALAAGEIDLAGLSAQAIALAVTEAKLDIRDIGQQLSGDVDGWGGAGFWVRKGEITKVEQLRGKVLGINARGSTPDANIRVMMSRHGLVDGKDYQVAELRFPAQIAALESRRIDLASLIQPFTSIAEKKPELAQLFTAGEAMGGTETLGWVGKADWIAKNRAALVDFLEDNMLLRRWLYDPKTRPQAVALVAKVTKRSPDDFAEWVYTRKDNYRDPHAMVNVARLQKNIDDLKALGLVPASIEADKVVDMSLAREAAARLTQ